MISNQLVKIGNNLFLQLKTLSISERLFSSRDTYLRIGGQVCALLKPMSLRGVILNNDTHLSDFQDWHEKNKSFNAQLLYAFLISFFSIAAAPRAVPSGVLIDPIMGVYMLLCNEPQERWVSELVKKSQTTIP